MCLSANYVKWLYPRKNRKMVVHLAPVKVVLLSEGQTITNGQFLKSKPAYLIGLVCLY